MQDQNTKTTEVALSPDQRAEIALGKTQTEQDLQQLAQSLKQITVVNSPAGREQAHALAMTATRARTTITNKGKEIREDATAFSKAVIKKVDELIEIIQPEETRVKALRDGWDEAERKRKEEALRIEQARIAAHTQGIEKIKNYAALAAQSRTASMVQELINKLNAVKLDSFEEFTDTATKAHADALEQINQIHAAKVADEAEKAREQAERERIAAEQAAQAKALEEQRAELERQQAELKAQQEEMARQAEAIAAASKPVEAMQPVQEAAADPAMEQTPAAVPMASTVLPITNGSISSYVANLAATVQVEDKAESCGVASKPVDIDNKPDQAPSAKSLISTVALEYGVTTDLAADWLAIRAPEFLKQEA